MNSVHRYSAGRTDVEIIDNDTKIVHNRILDIIGVRKPHDFCTLLHVMRVSDGTVLVRPMFMHVVPFLTGM